MEGAGGTRDYVLGVGEVQCSGGHGEVRKDRGYGDHEWAARRPGEDSGNVGKKPLKVLEEPPGIEKDHLAAAC